MKKETNSYIEWLKGKNVSLFTVKDYAEKRKRMNIKITPDDIINLCDHLIKINTDFVNRARAKGEVQ